MKVQGFTFNIGDFYTQEELQVYDIAVNGKVKLPPYKVHLKNGLATFIFDKELDYMSTPNEIRKLNLIIKDEN